MAAVTRFFFMDSSFSDVTLRVEKPRHMCRRSRSQKFFEKHDFRQGSRGRAAPILASPP